jgi:hypothetical protein
MAVTLAKPQSIRLTNASNRISASNALDFPGFETQWLDQVIMVDADGAGTDRNFSHSDVFLFIESDGDNLDGKYKYCLTFDLNDLPPVDEFWSIPRCSRDSAKHTCFI